MKKIHSLTGTLLVSILFAATSCNLPSAVPQLPEQVLLVVTATPPNTQAVAAVPATNTVGAIAAACYPMITANVDANIRKGPDTVYEIPQGGTAKVAGRNDANTWWYIEFAGGVGGYAWIAGSITTASCLPSVVQVVAAPPPPVVVAQEPANDQGNQEPEQPAEPDGPDLIISEFSIDPATPVMGQQAHVRIGAYNQGDYASGAYVLQWWGLSTFAEPSCTWNVASTAAHGGFIKQCNFTFQSWYPINKTSLAVIDVNNDVEESNEGNNQGTISPFGVTAP